MGKGFSLGDMDDDFKKQFGFSATDFKEAETELEEEMKDNTRYQEDKLREKAGF